MRRQKEKRTQLHVGYTRAHLCDDMFSCTWYLTHYLIINKSVGILRSSIRYKMKSCWKQKPFTTLICGYRHLSVRTYSYGMHAQHVKRKNEIIKDCGCMMAENCRRARARFLRERESEWSLLPFTHFVFINGAISWCQTAIAYGIRIAPFCKLCKAKKS